jgi:hypothetical protein
MISELSADLITNPKLMSDHKHEMTVCAYAGSFTPTDTYKHAFLHPGLCATGCNSVMISINCFVCEE